MYARLCQLNQQMILAVGPLDVNPTAVLLLQPLFLLLSLVGGTATMLPRTQTSQVFHSSPSATPLSRLPHLLVILVWGLAVAHRLAALGAVCSTNGSHQKRTIRESLTVGTHEVHGRKQGKFLLIKLFPPPDSWDPPEGPLYFTKKTCPR